MDSDTEKFKTGGIPLQGSERLMNKSKVVYLGEIFPVILKNQEL